jgi:hypothetical protein
MARLTGLIPKLTPHSLPDPILFRLIPREAFASWNEFPRAARANSNTLPLKKGFVFAYEGMTKQTRFQAP